MLVMNRNSIVPWPPFTPLLNGSLPLSQKGLSSPNMVAFNELWSKLQLSSCALLRHFLASAKELKSRRNISVTTEGYQEQSKINPALWVAIGVASGMAVSYGAYKVFNEWQRLQ